MGPKGQRLWPALVAWVPNWSSQMNLAGWGWGVYSPISLLGTDFHRCPSGAISDWGAQAGRRRSGGFRGTKACSVHPASERPRVDPSPGHAGAGGDRRPLKARNKGASGARAEVTCCLRGRLRRPGEGIGRKWFLASLENQFVPPLMGHFVPPLRE